jgi:solute carrier family 25 phosphate transporter 23/24/25/41
MAATMPLENVMRRLQVQGRPGFPRQYSGPLNCTLLMLRQEGVSSFWRGSLSSFAKVVPSIAATRVLYEAIVELRGIGGVRRYRVGADD